MALNYRRFSDTELSALNVLSAGEYEFYVSEISEGPSKGGTDKNGNPKKIYNMLTIGLKIYTQEGKERSLKDWVLIIDGEEPLAFKLRHFAATCGLLDKYDAGTLEARDFLNKHGKARLGVRDYIDINGVKTKQNSVLDYIKPIKTEASNSADPFDDDIKF